MLRRLQSGNTSVLASIVKLNVWGQYVWGNSSDSPRNCQSITLLLLLGDPRECGGNGHWERDYDETKTARGNEWRMESERQKKIKWGIERERKTEVREPADVKVPPITSCFSSAPSLCLSLSVPLFLSFVPTWIPLPALHSDVTLVFDWR